MNNGRGVKPLRMEETMTEFSTYAERQERYKQAEAEHQALVKVARNFRALIDSLDLGLHANVNISGRRVHVYVRQADDRMGRLMERKSWNIPAEELLKLSDKEKEQLALYYEKA